MRAPLLIAALLLTGCTAVPLAPGEYVPARIDRHAPPTRVQVIHHHHHHAPPRPAQPARSDLSRQVDRINQQVRRAQREIEGLQKPPRKNR
jgi:hypothetical protein